MNKFKIFLFLAFAILFFLTSHDGVLADGSSQFITVVNPVRISSYNKNSVESLKNEYLVIKKNDIPATWLLTYDALSNDEVLSFIKKMDKNQEFGIFLEITKKFAEETGVKYNDTGFWQHAGSVFLSGYSQEDRVRLIDKVFEKYREVFGSYPKSVGSWWTDSYSLSYMREKYGITANLVCSDQYSTDGYQIWGQPWEIAYYPSKLLSDVPANDSASKIDVVNVQWAPRDPLNGYYSSLYSTQDYLVAPIRQDTTYFQRIVDLYLSTNIQNGFSQVTVGLEADLDPLGYSGEYAKQIEYVRLLAKNVNVVTMSGFSDWYRKQFPNLTPEYRINTSDLLGKNIGSFWFGNENYRIFYTKDSDKKQIQIKDLRIYNGNLKDPYYDSPNYQFTLSENSPSVIDTASNLSDEWTIPSNSEIVPGNNGFSVKGENIKIPDVLLKSPMIKITRNNNEISVSFVNSQISPDGIEIKDFSSEAIHFFRQKLAILYLLIGRGWNYFTKVNYTIPQGEVYALLYLRSQPVGLVMVYDGECLQCSWHTKFKPPEFSNLRGYVSKYSGNPIVYNKSVFNARTQTDARREFDKLQVKYVYLAKFEGYSEKLPFSPGDLGVEKIFSNANAEIWKVK